MCSSLLHVQPESPLKSQIRTFDSSDERPELRTEIPRSTEEAWPISGAIRGYVSSDLESDLIRVAHRTRVRLSLPTMSAGKIVLVLVGLLVFGLIAVGLWAGGIYNRLVTLQQSTDAAWAQVENVYQRRTDLIPNLVNTVSGAANFERTTLTEVVDARASVGRVQIPADAAPTDPQKLAEFEQAQARLGGALSRLMVVVEKYPELRATAAFRDLQAQLEGTENRIAVERGRFNEAVQVYNTAIRQFPASILAGMFGHSVRPYFKATAGSDRPPAVNFDFGKKAATPAP